MGAWVPMQAADPLNFGRTVFLRVWTDEFDFTYSPKGNIFFYFQVIWPAVDFTYQWLLGDLLVDPACA